MYIKSIFFVAVIFTILFNANYLSAEKVPFKIIYDNDNTNLGTCLSPWNQTPGSSTYNPDWMAAAVDETANIGIDVHKLAPGTQWIPFFNSTSYSLQTHYNWFESTFGPIPSGNLFTYLNYIYYSGGDIIQDFIDRCQLRGLTPFISFRLNDGHLLEYVYVPYDPSHGQNWGNLCQFYYENPQYRLGTGGTWDDTPQNWVYEQVRDYKFNFLSEICNLYNIEGVELDFERYVRYFNKNETTSVQRKQIMADFIAQVRKLLDMTARPGQHRYLAVRIPCWTKFYDEMGIDLPAFVNAGVEMVNLSPCAFTVQQTDLADVRQMIPNTSLYLEIENMAGFGKDLDNPLSYNRAHWRRATDNMLYTAAHLAYADGADGISAFNFAYYRKCGSEEQGPFNEPPFHVFANLRDSVWVAAQPQHYILAQLYSNPCTDSPFPHTLSNCHSTDFNLKMIPPAGGWTADGKLRIQADDNLANKKLLAWFNGRLLQETQDVSEPYPNPYKGGNGDPEEFRAWNVPVNFINNGNNTITIKMGSLGGEVTLIFLDVAVQ